MFAWIDVIYIAAGVALGITYKDKIEAAIHGAEGYILALEAKLAAAKAKLASVVATAQADVKKVEDVAQADVAVVKDAAAAVQKTV